MQDLDRHIKIMIALLVQAINRGKDQRKHKELIDKFNRETPELERIIDWHGQQEVTLRMEISELKERLQDSEYKCKNLIKSLNNENLKTA